MDQIIVALLGVIGLLFAYRGFDKWNIDRNQNKLEKKVSDNDKTQAGLEGEQRQEDKETKRKVDEIDKEKANNPNGSDLADWFNRRK